MYLNIVLSYVMWQSCLQFEQSVSEEKNASSHLLRTMKIIQAYVKKYASIKQLKKKIYGFITDGQEQ